MILMVLKDQFTDCWSFLRIAKILFIVFVTLLEQVGQFPKHNNLQSIGANPTAGCPAQHNHSRPVQSKADLKISQSKVINTGTILNKKIIFT